MHALGGCILIGGVALVAISLFPVLISEMLSGLSAATSTTLSAFSVMISKGRLLQELEGELVKGEDPKAARLVAGLCSSYPHLSRPWY